MLFFYFIIFKRTIQRKYTDKICNIWLNTDMQEMCQVNNSTSWQVERPQLFVLIMITLQTGPEERKCSRAMTLESERAGKTGQNLRWFIETSGSYVCLYQLVQGERLLRVVFFCSSLLPPRLGSRTVSQASCSPEAQKGVSPRTKQLPFFLYAASQRGNHPCSEFKCILPYTWGGPVKQILSISIEFYQLWEVFWHGGCFLRKTFVRTKKRIDSCLCLCWCALHAVLRRRDQVKYVMRLMVIRIDECIETPRHLVRLSLTLKTDTWLILY